ncbi:MAG: hypothetical protein K6F91_02525 [Ruminococcus sp.]|nr:hypothetical protein [Ruminococcus sp.]
MSFGSYIGNVEDYKNLAKQAFTNHASGLKIEYVNVVKPAKNDDIVINNNSVKNNSLDNNINL